MSYGSYQVVKTFASIDADRKAKEQETLFSDPRAKLFAVARCLGDRLHH